jgi:hypothetical protein
MAERIVIGSEEEVKQRLQSGQGDVFYDKTHALGNLLFGFESDEGWDYVLQDLCNRKK